MRQQLTGDYNQRKLGRLIQVMVMLSKDEGCSITKLKELTGTTERTIYRYLNMFDQIGFPITKNNNRFKINNLTLKTSTNGNKTSPGGDRTQKGLSR